MKIGRGTALFESDVESIEEGDLMSSSDWKQPRPAGRVKRCVDALAEALESNGELTDEYIVEQVLDAWAARNPAEVAWDYQQAGAAVRASRRVDL